jgi:hypothetical protein
MERRKESKSEAPMPAETRWNKHRNTERNDGAASYTERLKNFSGQSGSQRAETERHISGRWLPLESNVICLAKHGLHGRTGPSKRANRQGSRRRYMPRPRGMTRRGTRSDQSMPFGRRTWRTISEEVVRTDRGISLISAEWCGVVQIGRLRPE